MEIVLAALTGAAALAAELFGWWSILAATVAVAIIAVVTCWRNG